MTNLDSTPSSKDPINRASSDTPDDAPSIERFAALQQERAHMEARVSVLKRSASAQNAAEAVGSPEADPADANNPREYEPTIPANRNSGIPVSAQSPHRKAAIPATSKRDASPQTKRTIERQARPPVVANLLTRFTSTTTIGMRLKAAAQSPNSPTRENFGQKRCIAAVPSRQ